MDDWASDQSDIDDILERPIKYAKQQKIFEKAMKTPMTPVIDPLDDAELHNVVWKLPPNNFHLILDPRYGHPSFTSGPGLKLIRIN